MPFNSKEVVVSGSRKRLGLKPASLQGPPEEQLPTASREMAFLHPLACHGLRPQLDLVWKASAGSRMTPSTAGLGGGSREASRKRAALPGRRRGLVAHTEPHSILATTLARLCSIISCGASLPTRMTSPPSCPPQPESCLIITS